MENQDQITLIDVLKKLLVFKQLIKRYFWKIVFFSFLIATAAVSKVYLKGKSYSASNVFIIDSSGGSGISKAMSLAKNFGLFGGKGEQINQETLLEIAQSKLILEKVLLKNVKIEGKEVLFGDYLFNFFEFNEGKFAEKYNLQNFSFNNQIKNDTIFLRQRILNMLVGKISGKVLEINADDENGLIEIKANSKNEEVAKVLSDNVYEELEDFYFAKSLASERKSMQILEKTIDSVFSNLEIEEAALAKLRDTKIATVKSEGFLEMLRGERRVKILNIMYAEAIKNHEMLSFSIKTKNTPFKLIESPQYPLKGNNLLMNMIKSAIIWGIIGFILVAIFILSRVMVKQILAKLSAIENE